MDLAELALALFGPLSLWGGLFYYTQRRRMRAHPDTSLAFRVAVIEAMNRGETHYSLLEVLGALLCDPEVGRELRANVSIEQLRERIAADLPPLRFDDVSSARPAVAPEVTAIVEAAHVAASRQPSPLDLVRAILDGPPGPARDLLEAAGARLATKSDAVEAHGATPGAAYRGGAERPTAQITLWNDKTTTLEFVLGLLVSTFGATTTEALYVALRTQARGSAVAGTYTADEARRRASSAAALAKEAGFSLRITVEPIDARGRPRARA